jgi:RNA polymerase sigma-70 factor, ECF subfamily
VNASSVTQLPELVAFLTNEPRPLREVSAAIPSSGSAINEHTLRVEDFRAWTRRIKSGEEPAFTGFYERYSLRTYKYLLVLTRGNELDAREVLQTVMLKTARRFKVFDEEPLLWAWLARLSRNAYVDLCRIRSRRHRFVPLKDQAPGLLQPAATESRLVVAMAQVVEQLEPDERELISAAYVDERPLQSLADESGQTYKAIESRLGRLRLKIKTRLLNSLRHE